MPEIGEKEAIEANAQERAREKAAKQREVQRRKQETAEAGPGGRAARRARMEVNREREVHSPTGTEVDVRRLERADKIEKSGLKTLKEVKPLELKYHSREDIDRAVEKAWAKLEKSAEGKALIKAYGGKAGLEKEILSNKPGLETRIASKCSLAELDASAAGRNVHRIAELYELEKHPGKILNGTIQVEQRIDYTDGEGKARHGELDHVREDHGKFKIRDHKPVNLSHFERTRIGKEWAAWAEKNVGKDFREQVMDGRSPFFQKVKDGLPKHIHRGLKEFIDRADQKAARQLSNYEKLYSEATGVDRELIDAQVQPYFVFR